MKTFPTWGKVQAPREESAETIKILVLREWKWDDFFPYLKMTFNPVTPFNSQKGAFALLEMLRSRKKYMPKMQNFLKITIMKTWHIIKNCRYV